ncbi:MAG: response regulator transcription factor [Pirellulaceae bacterium]|nr:response regulator transcription factor [Pirellulaceae bacterium]
MANPQLPNSKPAHRIHPEIWALLTPRETEILELFLVNPNDKAIARLLNTADSTIRKHLSAIERKAGVGSRAELLVFFLPPDR